MRACGISLYRSALPLLLFGAIFSGILYEMQEYVLPEANREAVRLNAIIRGYPIPEFGILNRQWILGKSGEPFSTGSPPGKRPHSAASGSRRSCGAPSRPMRSTA